MEGVYLSRNPTAKAVMDLIRSSVHSDDQICYDHVTFRTLGVCNNFYLKLPSHPFSCLFFLKFRKMLALDLLTNEFRPNFTLSPKK